MRLFYSPPFLLFLAVVAALLTYRGLDSRTRPPLIIHTCRWLLGVMFADAGLAKLIPHFPSIIGPPWLESRLAPFGLALFARFVAVSEVAVGALLLTRRFATLGAVMLVPMLASILVVTISLQWQGTPYVNAVLCLMNLGLLAYDYPRLRPLLGASARTREDQGSASPHPTSEAAWLLVLAAFLVVLALLSPPSGELMEALLIVGFLVALVALDWRLSRTAG